MFRLNADEQIQMVTALALQLIQCVVRIPRSVKTRDGEALPRPSDNVEHELAMTTSFQSAIHTAAKFLSVYLQK